MAKVETKLEYMQAKIAELNTKVDGIESKQDQMITLLTEANGMRKMLRWIYGAAVVAGGFVVAYWGTIKTFLAKLGG